MNDYPKELITENLKRKQKKTKKSLNLKTKDTQQLKS